MATTTTEACIVVGVVKQYQPGGTPGAAIEGHCFLCEMPTELLPGPPENMFYCASPVGPEPSAALNDKIDEAVEDIREEVFRLASQCKFHNAPATICPNVTAMNIPGWPMVNEDALDVFGELEMYWEFKVFAVGVCEMVGGECEKMYRSYFEIGDDRYGDSLTTREGDSHA